MPHGVMYSPDELRKLCARAARYLRYLHTNTHAMTAELMEELEAAGRGEEWISVDEQLPEAGVEVLCYRPKAPESGDPKIKLSFVRKMYHSSPQGVRHPFECWCHVTHWAPLPSPPKEPTNDL